MMVEAARARVFPDIVTPSPDSSCTSVPSSEISHAVMHGQGWGIQLEDTTDTLENLLEEVELLQLHPSPLLGTRCFN